MSTNYKEKTIVSALNHTYTCIICGSPELQELPSFSSLSRVTSDCRPFRPGGRIAACNGCGGIQKFCDPQWLAEITEIYGTYTTYNVVGPIDQMILDPQSNNLKARCEVLGEQLIANLKIPENGKWLDYGCGRGAMLQATAKLLPKWRLNGFDLNRGQLPYLTSIQGFENLYDTNYGEIDDSFDIISMVHSLEHFTNPFSVLTRARNLLAKGGKLFIQVNDTRKNPFELLVADHLAHFVPHTLCEIVERAGFEVKTVTNEWVTKEISLVATPHTNVIPSSTPFPHSKKQSRMQISQQLDWLMKLVESGKNASDISPIGIFGSSVAATWLHEHLEDRVLFFVDEDPSKIGKSHCGKPIFQPSEVEPGSQILIGLIPEIANAIYDRLKQMPLKFILPNPLLLQ